MNKMHALLPAAVLCLAAALPAQASAGQVEVSYVKPADFRDAGRGEAERDRTMKTLTQYLRNFASRLPDGQTLRIEVTDIDLAGEVYPNRSLTDLRVLRGGADGPHVDLRFTLLDASRTLKSGEVRLSDPAYLFGVQRPPIDSDLSHEKRMLKRWFDDHIVVARR